MSHNLRSGLVTTGLCVWIVAGVAFGGACILSMGDSLQPDKNQVQITRLEKGLVKLGVRVNENRFNLLPDVQRAVQRKGFFLLVADSSSRPIVFMRKR